MNAESGVNTQDVKVKKDNQPTDDAEFVGDTTVRSRFTNKLTIVLPFSSNENQEVGNVEIALTDDSGVTTTLSDYNVEVFGIEVGDLNRGNPVQSKSTKLGTISITPGSPNNDLTSTPVEVPLPIPLNALKLVITTREERNNPETIQIAINIKGCLNRTFSDFVTIM